MNWEISKEFDFCYGHRVWSQELNSEFSLDSCLACRHLHGHQGKVIVYLPGNELKNGMVTDFKHLNWFKKWLDSVLDHKFIIDRNDPLFEYELPHFKTGEIFLRSSPQSEIGNASPYFNIEFDAYHKNDLPKPLVEKYEGIVVVNFVPTSENLAKWLFDIVSSKMKQINIKVSKLELYETPKSRSIYHA